MKKVLLIFILLVILVSLSGKYKILLIESYHKEYAWDQEYNVGLSQTLPYDKYEIVNFYMDTKRVPADQYQAKANEAWEKFNSDKYDLVVLGDDNAMQFLGHKFSEVKTPVVFLGINNNPRNYFNDRKLPENITGVLERPLLKRSIIYLKNLIPKSENILVLFDSGNTAKIVQDEYFKSDIINIAGTKVEIQRISSWEKWKENILELNKKYDAVIIGLYHTLKDQNGTHISADKVIEWSSENTPVPAFGFWGFSVGENKTIGGFTISGVEQGIVAGNTIINILENGNMPEVKTQNKGQFLFSKKQVEKWKINIPDKIRPEVKFID